MIICYSKPRKLMHSSTSLHVNTGFHFSYKYPEMGLLGCMVCLILQEMANLCAKVSVNFTFWPATYKRSSAPYPHQHLVLSVILIFHYGFNLHFSDDYWCRASFHVLTSYLYTFFMKYVFKYFAHILGCNFFIRYMFCIYFLPLWCLLPIILMVLF